MPNWCENTLTITAKTADELLVFIDQNSSQEEDGFRPLNFYNSVPSSKGDDWYQANLANWGTKWNAGTDENKWEKTGDTKYEIKFETAWAPPIPWLKTVSLLYPNLVFKLSYVEEGFQFYGTTIMIEGVADELDLTPSVQQITESYQNILEDKLEEGSKLKKAVTVTETELRKTEHAELFDYMNEKGYFEFIIEEVLTNIGYEE